MTMILRINRALLCAAALTLSGCGGAPKRVSPDERIEIPFSLAVVSVKDKREGVDGVEKPVVNDEQIAFARSELAGWFRPDGKAVNAHVEILSGSVRGEEGRRQDVESKVRVVLVETDTERAFAEGTGESSAFVLSGPPSGDFSRSLYGQALRASLRQAGLGLMSRTR